MSTKIPYEMTESIEAGEYDLAQTLPLARQLWRRQLYLVATGMRTFVGLIPDPGPGPIVMYGTLDYIAQYTVNRQPPVVAGDPPLVEIGMFPQLLCKIDDLAPAQIVIHAPDWMLRIHDQSEEWQDIFFREYQRHFDEPLVELV